MEIIHFEKLDSTNKYAIENIDLLSNFSIVEASYQTNGKGRETRQWISNKGENLLFSLVIKDSLLIKRYNALSMYTASIIRDLIENELNIKDTMIKWPNDVYIKDKKVCGILLQGDITKYIVIGIGINVNQRLFNGDFRVSPTSLAIENNNLINMQEFKNKLYNDLVNKLNLLKTDDFNPIDQIRKYNYLLNKETEGGVVIGINEDYSLKLSTKSGLVDINSGEIDIKN